jgi:hypothetical protein
MVRGRLRLLAEGDDLVDDGSPAISVSKPLLHASEPPMQKVNPL